MSPDELKQLTDRFLEAWNQCDTGMLQGLLATDFVYHSHTYGDMDLEGYMKHAIGVHAAYPDAHLTVEQALTAEGNHVVWQMTFHGTDSAGSIALGTPPTGKQVTMRMISVARLKGNQLEEQWIAEDAFGLIKQLKG